MCVSVGYFVVGVEEEQQPGWVGYSPELGGKKKTNPVFCISHISASSERPAYWQLTDHLEEFMSWHESKCMHDPVLHVLGSQ